MRTLQDMLSNLDPALPPAWQGVRLDMFSPQKPLRDYQQEALRFALRALWKYYQDLRDYQPGESERENEGRKDGLWAWYRANGMVNNLDIPLANQRRDIRSLLTGFYAHDGGNAIPYHHFINRMCFWMATGSGKSLVLIKLIEQLHALIVNDEIPPLDVLVLTARDDLLEQLRQHVEEFNCAPSGLKIRLESLKSYPNIKQSFMPTIGANEITVFTYRADNLSDEQKERLLDVRNYENAGRWYVLLDEAHKGDREDSKRQHIYSILSRNGFLFNFSATFTDPRDILTTAYNFNLAEFVRAGYSKHIAVLKQENRAFASKEDYTNEEKQRIVLKALLLLAHARRAWAQLPVRSAYHSPLGLVLVNSVNTQDADLKLFFRELERIGQGLIEPHVWQQACDELDQELQAGAKWMFENDGFKPASPVVASLTQDDLLRLVYNAGAPGKIEVLTRSSNQQELAFKLKTAEQPFALIKIGDISNWLKRELQGYEVTEKYADESFFAGLNADDSPINLLMGSRSFYEGWDSNRPNVITYINIGTGTQARKFILQSIGRGVRIAPLNGQRRRLLALYNSGDVNQNTFDALSADAPILETLFVFGANRNALETVIHELDQQKRHHDEHEITLDVNRSHVEPRVLLIPAYKVAGHTIAQARNPRKFEIASEELSQLARYVEALEDKLLLGRHPTMVESVRQLRQYVRQPETYFNTATQRRFGRMDLLLSHLLAYFQLKPQEFDGLKPLGDEIRHFRHIRVFLKDISDLKQKIAAVQSAPRRLAELKERYHAGQITLDELLAQVQATPNSNVFIHGADSVHIKRLAQHYYVPLLLTDNERIDWIRHIIRTPSEVRFLDALEKHLDQKNNAFLPLDCWAFSKVDETLDDVYLPYYDPQSNRIRRFFPDFVFWLVKDNRYAIVFVDPKGMRQADYQYKVDGYCELFWDNGAPRIFDYEGYRVSVHLLLYTQDANTVSKQYRAHWFDRAEAIAACISQNCS